MHTRPFRLERSCEVARKGLQEAAQLIPAVNAHDFACKVKASRHPPEALEPQLKLVPFSVRDMAGRHVADDSLFVREAV